MRTTVSEPLVAVAPVTPRDSRSAIPRPREAASNLLLRPFPSATLFHPPLRSFTLRCAPSSR